MTKPAKVVLGIATLWPVLYMLIFFVFIFSQVFLGIVHEKEPSPHAIAWRFGVIFALHFLTILWMFGLEIIYIVNVFKNDRVGKDKKALWAVVLFMGNMVAMPVYWYLYIWRQPPRADGGTSPNTALPAPGP